MYDAVIPENPNYKEAVGNAIYPFVQQLVNDRAPKITGMLIEFCPIDDIRLILKSYRLLVIRVAQANEEIERRIALAA